MSWIGTKSGMMIAARIAIGLIVLAILAAVLWRWQTNGWGSLGWLLGVIAMNFIRAPFARQSKKNTIVESRRTVLERALLAGMALGGLVPFLHLATGALAFADYSLPHWATGAGVLLFATALWLFWRSHADLGRNWSVTLELREDHGLIMSGVYERIRHPMYAAIWLIVLVQPLLVQNWIAGPIGIVAFGLLYAFRTPREEAMMRERFGAAYDGYCRSAGRLLPRWR